MSKLSVIIICKNEAINILDCIKSASFADELIVLDSGSDDGTIDLVKSTEAKLLITDWPGYGVQKNRAIAASSGDWIFSLDADERISSELAEEIRNTISAEMSAVFDVPRSSLYVSKFMKHSGWNPDRTKRLFKRGYAKFSENIIHESLETNEVIGHLKAPLIHYSFRDFETVLIKINEYSTLSAKQSFSNKKTKASLKKAILHGMWAFFRTYLIKAGFLDGREGFMLAVSNAEGVYYRYLKIMQLQNNNNAN
jgi:glycosyltransferase involved in cell wall biosynthesis